MQCPVCKKTVGAVIETAKGKPLTPARCFTCTALTEAGTLPYNIRETKTAELDGRTVRYTENTAFIVQSGIRAYKTRYQIVGNLAQAVLLYRGLGIGNGYKKRLLMRDAWASKHTVLATARS